MALHPHHQHPLIVVDPISLYPEHNGRWKCDNCNVNYERQSTPHHCKICCYDLCQSCFNPHSHPRHNHPLYYTHMMKIYPAYRGRWKCDACHTTHGPPEEPFAYHCFQCEFDLCRDCFSGRACGIHIHRLVPADSLIIYGRSTGLWVCNVCQRTGQDIGTQYSWHCPECEFDTCNQCMAEVTLSAHEHPLKITDSRLVYAEFNGGWKCDICLKDASPDMRNYDKPYHCYTCQYDACYDCVNRPGFRRDGMLGMDVAGPPCHDARRNNGPQDGHKPPAEFLDDSNEEDAGEDVPDSDKCIVCIQRRKTATIVHGNTGHVSCCVRCALILHQNGRPCPICRAPIDRVIKQFVT